MKRSLKQNRWFFAGGGGAIVESVLSTWKHSKRTLILPVAGVVNFRLADRPSRNHPAVGVECF